MKAFHYIIKKMLQLDDNIFTFDKSENDKFAYNFKEYNLIQVHPIQVHPIHVDPIQVDPIIKAFFNILFTTSYSIKNKFLFYKDTIANIFLNSKLKEIFNEYFYKIQFVYLQFQKIAYIYKLKKTKFVVNTDMGLNTIVENERNVICIYQDKGKYLFNILDLNKIIYNSLTHQVEFFSEPKPIKNPYNNLPFNKSNLYNIYFFIKFNTYYTIDLFEKYFELDFNLGAFNEKYEHLLRDITIKNFVYKSSINVLFKKITTMIEYFNKNNPMSKINIHNDFPIERLVKIMRPYLFLYMSGLYSMVISKKSYYNIKLNLYLNKFYKFNPFFGRKKIVINYKYYNQSKPYINENTFNDKHIIYNKKEEADFFSNHSNTDYAYQYIQDVINYERVNNFNNRLIYRDVNVDTDTDVDTQEDIDNYENNDNSTINLYDNNYDTDSIS